MTTPRSDLIHAHQVLADLTAGWLTGRVGPKQPGQGRRNKPTTLRASRPAPCSPGHAGEVRVRLRHPEGAIRSTASLGLL